MTAGVNMAKIHGRAFTESELDIIESLWPTDAKNSEIAARVGRRVGVLLRAAEHHLGLRSRKAARRYASLVSGATQALTGA